MRRKILANAQKRGPFGGILYGGADENFNGGQSKAPLHLMLLTWSDRAPKPGIKLLEERTHSYGVARQVPQLSICELGSDPGASGSDPVDAQWI